MPFTRAQAESLLNQRELALFDDSRINALRRLDAAGIERRMERTRKARDRARDLLRRQQLATRARTGSKRGAGGDANQRSKRKAELLADILGRFQGQLAAARRRERGQAAEARRAGPAARAKPAARSGRAPIAGKSPAAKRTARKAAASGVRGESAGAGRGDARKLARRITPKRALAKTRKLLEAKQAREREGQPWQTLSGQEGSLPQPGYQSEAAARKAQELHAGESRMASIHGSISTRDRRNQGKRDHRSDGD